MIKPTSATAGVVAVHGLLEMLDHAADRAGVERAIRRWAATHLAASDVVIELGIPPALRCDAAVDTRASADGGSVLVVDARGDGGVRLTLTSSLAVAHVSEPVRKTLIVAGRLFAAALARVGAKALADRGAGTAQLTPAATPSVFGTSPHAQQLTALVARLARSEVNVLIGGETGVGKTFVARMIHESSARAREALRVVNCAAIPESLLESQLFGHERGAFTGASAARVGVLEAAGSGTVLLDEIGELSLASQAKLLHVLEERRFERVGANRAIRLDARLLCATNRNLDEMVRSGQFRRDLLFRISVVRLEVPPLRAREPDLMLLAESLLAEARRSSTRVVSGFSDEAKAVIQSYSWPGNVRELRNAVEHALALGEGPLIRPDDFPPGVGPRAPQPDDPDLIRLPTTLAALERRAIDASLRATKGNRQRAATLLGVTRQTLYNKLRAHSLSP